MNIEFFSSEFEHLKTAYYDDFFFQHVSIIDKENEESLLSSDFQGKFLQSVWDVLIDFEKEESTKKVKQYGKMNYYTFSLMNNDLMITLNGSDTMKVSYLTFYQAFYEATKNYLTYIRRENPRVALDEHYQQLSASCYYYERRLTNT